jgi:hypothetical protein
MRHHRIRMDARAAGARAPEKHALSRKILTATTKPEKKMQDQRSPVIHLWQEPYLSPKVKTFKITGLLLPDTPVFVLQVQKGLIQDNLSGNTGSFSPIKNSRYFSAIAWFRARDGFRTAASGSGGLRHAGMARRRTCRRCSAGCWTR